MYGFSKPPGVPCPPNNPHCHGMYPPDAPIDQPIFILLSILFATALFICFRRKQLKKETK